MHLSFARLLQPSSVALVSVLALIVIIVPAVGALLAARRHDNDDTVTRKRARYARTMLVLWTVTAVAMYALSLHGESIRDVGFHAPVNAVWYAVGPALVAFILLVSGAGRGDISASYARAIRIVVPQDAGEWRWFVPVAATAAICEEFLYRGFAVTQFALLTNSLTAGVIVSSIAFGLGHAYQGRVGMVGTAVTGLFYAMLFVLSGSLWPCMIAHFLQDIAGAAILSRRLRSIPNESR